jgi:D-sedoheptulose 7-phosphate isomerase
MDSTLSSHLARSAEAAASLASDVQAVRMMHGMAETILAALRNGGKLLVAGNGGSAADAQHIAAEFVSRLMFDRAPLAALALSESGPILTACGNDYGFETVFARQVTALGRAGDVLLALSTSGNSPNLLRAGEAARDLGLVTLGFAGRSGGAMAGAFGQVFCAPSDNAQVVQQLHMTAAHAVLAQLEYARFAGAAA